VSRVNRPQLGWKQPPEWDRFEAAVEEEYGRTTPYRGFVLERAWQEFKDEHPAEEYADQLLRAVGIRDNLTQEKNLPRDVGNGDNGRVWVSVSVEVKREMEQFATENNVPNHKVLRAVVCWYLGGGLLGRLTEKLKKAVPEAEEQLADLNPDDDRSLTAEERKLQYLAKDLTVEEGPGMFTAEDFGKALEEMPYRGGDTTYMREKWLPRILDRLGYTRHPENPDLFVPEEQARELADDPRDLNRPAIDRLPYANLDDEERIRGLRIEAVRRATGRTTGRYALNVETVRDEVFDGSPSKWKTKDLMNNAGQADGFSTDVKGNRKRLKIDLSEVDRELLSDAGLDVGGFDKAEESGTSNEGETDVSNNEDVNEQMDALMNTTRGRGGR